MMKVSKHYMLDNPGSIQEKLYHHYQHLCSIYQFLIRYIIKLIQYMISLDGRLYDQNTAYPDM